MQAGRTRWKIENQNNTVLKTQGYHLTHPFGHGKQHLPRLLNNSRFLILPWLRIPNLASQVLALSMRTVADDWERHYGLRPGWPKTCVDSSRFTGHCYRAVNWIDVGLTTGRGRPDRDHQRHRIAPKRVLLYPLRHDARERLLSDSK